MYIKITDLDGGQKVGQRPAAPCPKRMTWAGREPPKRDHTNEVDRKGIEPVSMHKNLSTEKNITPSWRIECELTALM